jgi:alkyldihydroxyacetonephosphate synthase
LAFRASRDGRSAELSPSPLVDLVGALTRAVPGAQVSASAPDRALYARDMWPRRLIELRSGSPFPERPQAIIWPNSAEDVVKTVRFAREQGVAIVPFGAGSGVCGAVSPDARSIVVDLKKLDAHHIDPEAPLLTVGAGAMGITLEEQLARKGYTVGHFPSSIFCSTVGGWLAARGVGQCSGRYGKIEDMVAGLECVLGTGELVELKWRRSRPNLIPLVIGSEGTLGVITKVRLRLHPAPQERVFSAFAFPDVAAGWNALRKLFQTGLRPAVSRLYDPVDSLLLKDGSGGTGSKPSALELVLSKALRIPRALNRAAEALGKTGWGRAPLVLIFEGATTEASADSEHAARICQTEGAEPMGEGPARAWFEHRYSISYRQSAVFRAGAFSDTMEVAAPWSGIERLYNEVRRALGEHVLVLAHLSHAYPDGCSIYFTFSGAARDDAEAVAIYDRAWQAGLQASIAAGGTLSHHHGVGRSKAPRLRADLGVGVDMVRSMMRAWDPDRILNPGNLLPSESARPIYEPLSAAAASQIQADPQVDSTSLLASLSGNMDLEAAETWLQKHGFTLRLSGETPNSATIASWIGAGAPGAPDPWSDPVDHLIAGLVVRLASGSELVIRPAPRRAVGPDLIALFSGTGGQVGSIERATLRVYLRDEPEARAVRFSWPRDPPLEEAERVAWARLVEELGGSATRLEA